MAAASLSRLETAMGTAGHIRPMAVPWGRTATGITWSEVTQTCCATMAPLPDSTLLPTHRIGRNDGCQAGLPPAGERCIRTAYGLSGVGLPRLVTVPRNPKSIPGMVSYKWFAVQRRLGNPPFGSEQ